VTVWESFCQLHKELFDIACDEYLTLLESNIEKLESMLPKKEVIIGKVNVLENERAALIDKINASGVLGVKVAKASELIAAFEAIDKETGITALKNLNALLIDIIQKLQEQNKKNQLFLNKAMLSLKEIKQGFTGKKTYTTYGADGMTRTIGR
jgi:flagellar biosynthesis/type III secretory pathway chaperone